jgi:hypothetical protein
MWCLNVSWSTNIKYRHPSSSSSSGHGHSASGFSFNATSSSSFDECFIDYVASFHMDKDGAIFCALNECNTTKIFVGDCCGEFPLHIGEIQDKRKKMATNFPSNLF